MTTYAYCWRSGIIEFGSRVPDGALPISSSKNDSQLRDHICACSRHAYDGKTLLVPGVPEAADDGAAYDAYVAFKTFANARPSRKAGAS